MSVIEALEIRKYYESIGYTFHNKQSENSTKFFS